MITAKIFLVSCYLSLLARAHVFSLSDLSWTLRNQNGSIVVPGSVPSQTHLDLNDAGVIGHPLAGINEYTERWVLEDNWTYTADLTPWAHSYGSSESDKTLLVFYGIDTIANITFAGHPVAWVNNQFRRYSYDVSGFLESPIGDDNNLTIALESAWYYGLNVTARPDAEPLPEGLESSVTLIYPNRQWIRKSGGDFGWSSAPAFLPSGVYKPAYIVTLSDSDVISELPDDPAYPHASSAILLEETSVDIYKYGQSVTFIDQTADWVVNVTFGIRSAKSYTAPIVTLSIPELGITSQPLALNPIPAGTQVTTYLSANWSIPDATPERWYTHDLGTPKLYNLTITLNPSGNGQGAGPTYESITQTITTGFRTIQLMQTAYSEEEIVSRGITPGDQWHFEINGRAFYSKGSSFVPLDPFYSLVDSNIVRWTLESAMKSGQNMLQVWGGGVYQPSDAATDGGLYDFYSLCDELGILVWSELSFARDFYPTNTWFVESVELEIRQNVRRINKHPSNALWAGGHDGEVQMKLVEVTADGPHYIHEFVDLFEDYFHDVVLSETNSISYVDSSVTNGSLSVDPYTLRFANGTPGYIYGNSEYYNYEATQIFNLSLYPVSRFVSAFGFHSMPSFYTWQEVLESPEDFSFNSTVVMSRDHHPAPGSLAWPNPNAPEGQGQMTSAVELLLPRPGTSDVNQTFTQWCWSTQLFQSLDMAAQIAWYRRGAGMAENNLGSLVWQLNDVWQGVSWSAIEFYGRWKVLNYGLTSAFAPVTIRPFWMSANETLTVLATSDQLETVDGTAQLTWYDWSGRVLNTSTIPFSIPPLNNSHIYEETGLAKILPTGYNASDVWLLMNVSVPVDGTTLTHESYFIASSLGSAGLVDPEIVVRVSDNYTFTLSAQGGVGVWTWLDHPYGTLGYFEDTTTGRPSNGYYLVPGIDRTVKFVQNMDLSPVQNPDPSDFVVRSVWNNTHL